MNVAQKAAPKAISDQEYSQFAADMKTAAAKRNRDISHLKQLLLLTHVNRRVWIDATPSSELRLTTVLDTFPCFRQNDVLLKKAGIIQGQG